MFAGGGIGTTTTDKKKMLRRQLGSGLLIAALAGAVILMNHFFFLQEQGFSKNLTGVLVTRLVGGRSAQFVTRRSRGEAKCGTTKRRDGAAD